MMERDEVSVLPVDVQLETLESTRRPHCSMLVAVRHWPASILETGRAIDGISENQRRIDPSCDGVALRGWKTYSRSGR